MAHDAGQPIDITHPAAVRKQIDQAKGNIKIAVRFSSSSPTPSPQGRMQEAVAKMEALFAAVKPIPGALERKWRFHWGRAMAYLRLAEIENCIARHNDECCVFPLKGGGVHTDKSPAEQAAASFADYLAIEPERSQRSLAAEHRPHGARERIPTAFRRSS